MQCQGVCFCLPQERPDVRYQLVAIDFLPVSVSRARADTQIN